MTLSSSRHQGRRLLITAVLIALATRPASAELVPAVSRDTVTPYMGRWHDELAGMLARIAAAVDSGFAAPERELVLKELGAIRPQEMVGSHGPYPTRSYLLRVRFRGHESDVGLHMYWPGPRAVAFHVRSPDKLLLEAIDSTFHAARVALLSAPARVRLRLEDHYVWNGEAPSMIVALGVDEAKHCPDFGIETRGESRGDTVVIHVDGAAPKESCPYGYWPPQMSHWRPVVPGRYHIAIDSRGDTNRFAVDVTDTSLALTTIRSTFAVADERIRWRVPSGSFVLSCSRFFSGIGPLCDELQGWTARRPGVQRIAFDPRGVSPLRDSALAYRYDDRALASIRTCIATINPVLRQRASIDLRIRPPSVPWVVDRVANADVATRVASDSSCGLPRSIVVYGKALASYPLNCPTPTMNARRFVADVFRIASMAQWLRDHDVPVPTAETLEPLSGRRETARCRQIDSTSVRHPVAVFRAGRYFIATNIDGRDTLTLDGPVRGHLVWLLDSAGNVLQVPGSTTRAVPPAPRGDVRVAPKRPGAAPQDVHVTSTRSGIVLLQWGTPGTSPSFYELQRAGGRGAFATIGTVEATARFAVDTTVQRATAYRYRLLARFFLPGDSASSNEVRVTTPRVATPRLAWPTEPYLRPAVYGRVLDSLTGRPVPNLYLFVRGRMIAHTTDSLGRYRFSGLPPGRHEVTFSCPTRRTWRGRVVATRRIDVTAATDRLVDFHILLRNCEEPPLRTWSGEFRGHYSAGFEVSGFTPCTPLESFEGTAYEDERRHGAWVSFSETAGDQLVSMRPRDEPPTDRYPRLFVRWRATVTGPGRYGHMGLGLYDMRVTEVLEVRRAAPSDCQRSNEVPTR